MIPWKDKDPRLPVSLEIANFYDVFSKVYNFGTKIWKILDQCSHTSTNRKSLEVVEDDSKEHLGIIYCAGHGVLTKDKLLFWVR